MSKIKVIKDDTFNCRMNSVIKEKFIDMVDKENTTMSAYLERILVAELKKKGYKHIITKSII